MSDFEDDYDEPRVSTTKKSKEGNFKTGLLVGLGATLGFELVLGLALDTQGNLVHRYISYMLGIMILFVTALIIKRTFATFIASGIIIISSFALPYFLPDIFAPLMAPFLNLFPIIDRILASAGTLGIALDPATQSTIDLVFQFGFVLDLLLALFVGGMASLGISGVLKIMRGKVGILTIFTFGFTVLFFVLGVVIMPYILVVTSGGFQFAMSFGVGTLSLTEGMSQVSGNGSIDDANAFFAEAKQWYLEAEDMLIGLDNLFLFTLMGQARPTLIPIIENGLYALNAGIDLAQGVGPLLAGVAQIQTGITKSMGVFSPSTTVLGLSATPAEISTFNEGLDEMELGFANITEAINDVQSALANLQLMDEDELNAALISEGVGDVSEQLDLINDAVTLFSGTLDVLKVLITRPDTGRAPFIHLIQGAFALSAVGDSIGSSSSFEGTGAAFSNVVGNLSVVVNTFDDPVFTDFDNLNFSDGSPVTEMKVQISGMFAFIRDAGDVTVNMGEFGIIAAPTLISMNQSLSILNPSTSPYENFTVIPNSVYDEKIAVLDDVRVNATIMKNLGSDTDIISAAMTTRSAAGEYGFMSDAAADFASLFSEFNLTENGENFFRIAGGFQNLMGTAKSLKLVNIYVSNIQTDLDTILSELAGIPDNATITTAVGNMDANLTLADGELNTTTALIANAVGNFSLVSNMPQLTSTADSLANISDNILNIQGRDDPQRGITRIRELTNDPSDFLLNILTYPGLIETELLYIQGEFGIITGEMGNVEIAS